MLLNIAHRAKRAKPLVESAFVKDANRIVPFNFSVRKKNLNLKWGRISEFLKRKSIFSFAKAISLRRKSIFSIFFLFVDNYNYNLNIFAALFHWTDNCLSFSSIYEATQFFSFLFKINPINSAGNNASTKITTLKSSSLRTFNKSWAI